MEKFGGEEMGKPEKVFQAQIAGDINALSAMGRKGAEVTNAKKAEARNRAEAWDIVKQERNETDEDFRKKQAGEDIIPVDNIE